MGAEDKVSCIFDVVRYLGMDYHGSMKFAQRANQAARFFKIKREDSILGAKYPLGLFQWVIDQVPSCEARREDAPYEELKLLFGAVLADGCIEWSFPSLVRLAREKGLFSNYIGAPGAALGQHQKSRFGKLLTQYDGMKLHGHQLRVFGYHRGRRYIFAPEEEKARVA